MLSFFSSMSTISNTTHEWERGFRSRQSLSSRAERGICCTGAGDGAAPGILQQILRCAQDGERHVARTIRVGPESPLPFMGEGGGSQAAG